MTKEYVTQEFVDVASVDCRDDYNMLVRMMFRIVHRAGAEGMTFNDLWDAVVAADVAVAAGEQKAER